MDDRIIELALDRGVPASTLRLALAAGDAQRIADVLGMDRDDFERAVFALASSGIRPSRAVLAAALGA